MTRTEALATLQEGFETLSGYASLIARLPLEDWRDALLHAESFGPILDPTLYRDYLQSGRGEILKPLLDAAIRLKQTVLNVQPQVLAALERESKKGTPNRSVTEHPVPKCDL